MKRILLILTLLAVSSFAIAGDLNPPAAPGSTMKTLGEVEPRIPLGQADFPVTINESGSYYLTENVTISTASNAFYIDADDVSIDLMGFTVKGVSSGNTSGVYINDKNNTSISNGTFDGFGYVGVYCLNGKSHSVKNVTIRNCAKGGIYLSAGESSVDNCRILNCGTGRANAFGIYLGGQSRVANCLIKDCGADSSGSIGFVYAIWCGRSSHIVGNTIDGNFESSTARYIYGIRSDESTLVKDNTLTQNCVNANGYCFYGISVATGAACIGNSVSKNAYGVSGTNMYGILGSNGCLIKGNIICNNFTDSSIASSYGLRAAYGCLVDSNVIRANTGVNMYASADCVLGTNLVP